MIDTQPHFHPTHLPWCEPLSLAAQVQAEHWVLLYSGRRTDYSGRFSYLACGLRAHIQAEDFLAFSAALSTQQAQFDNAWFGYLGYGLKDALETLEPDSEHWLPLPALSMLQFGHIYLFDHDTHTLTLWSDGKDTPPIHPPFTPLTALLPPVQNLSSNMTRAEYLAKAAQVIEEIHAGELYQANLTRKFRGEFAADVRPFAVFERLCQVSPAPYSAFLQLGDISILSSSPEAFLSVDAHGHVTTRPIKGTAPRSDDPTIDAALRHALEHSEKDRAENLMIVDLMRNDLSRSCVAGSVQVSRLFDITTHPTIHHLSSTITGTKKPDCSILDIVSTAFPPGSMTGAPKIKAMNLCSRLEKEKRGVYSGALGWFGGNGSCELSVVIRTLLLKGRVFEFQVGGGIVADSTPAKELEELLDKAKAISQTLQIERRDLEGL